jgi:prepilin-type N-terminal cleavage/methylation domain-containing protein
MDRELKLKNQKGFSLVEVTVAITIFAFFATAFLTGQGYNVQDSALSQEQLVLEMLAEREINKLYIDPPKFTNVTANTKETKKFEEAEFKEYEYTLEISKIVLPDFSKLFSQKGGTTEEANDAYEGNYFNNSTNGNRNSTIETMVFNEVKKNIERIIWQARVTVTNKETKYSVSLSTFITNFNEKIQLNVSF